MVSQPNQWNVGHLTISVSALQTNTQSKYVLIWTEHKLSSHFHISRLGWCSETCRLNCAGPLGWSSCFHTYLIWPWGQGSHSYRPLELSISDHQGMAQTVGKKSISRHCYWTHKPWPPETLKLLTATSATTNLPPSPAKTRLTIALRLRSTIREILALQRLPNAEKAPKFSLSTWQSSSQVKCVCCTVATSTQRFESSPNKQAHFLGSLSPLEFKVARFRDIKPTYLADCRLWSGSRRGWGYQRRASEIQCRAQSWLGHPWTLLWHL